MKRLIACIIIATAAWTFGQSAIWEKKGVTTGVINDIVYDSNRSLTIIATDSGVFSSSDTINWTPHNDGLHDFRSLKLDRTIVNLNSIYLVLTVDALYALNAGGSGSWIYADDAGLTDTSGNVLGYRNANAVAFYRGGTALYAYLSIENYGLFRREFDPGTESWIGSWVADTNYNTVYNPYITDLLSVNGAVRLLVSAKNHSGPAFSGGIFILESDTWSTSSTDTGKNYISLAGNQNILAGTLSSGLYSSSNYGSGFSQLCNPGGITGPFPAVGIFNAVGVAGTGDSIYHIDPSQCPAGNPFTPYATFSGYARSFLPTGSTSTLVGTAGDGLWFYSDPQSPGEPRGNAGQTGVTTGIESQSVTDIAIAKSTSRLDAPPVIFTASGTDGLYKCFKPTYCTRYFYAPSRKNGVQGTSVALVPDYDEFGPVSYVGSETTTGQKTLYLSTLDFGLFRSDNGGASWKKLINFPPDANGEDPKIVKVVVSPNFPTDKTVFAITRKGSLHRSTDGGETWDYSEDLSLQYSDWALFNDLAISPAYNGAEPSTQILFIANSLGLLKGVGNGSGFDWTIPFNLAPVLSLALSPYFGMPDNVDPMEKTTVLVGTDGSGLYASTDSGDTFSNLFTGSPLESASVFAIQCHPKSDVGPAGDRLLTYFTAQPFAPDATTVPGLYYLRYDTAMSTWAFQQVDTGNSLPVDYMLKSIAFFPDFNGIDNTSLLVGHFSKGLYMGTHTVAGNSTWQPRNGFYNTPERINAIAECPDPDVTNPNKVVLIGTTDFGTMISFNGGESYYPWGFALEYESGGEKYTLHDVYAVGCSDVIDPCGEPTPCPYRRMVSAGSTCDTYGSFTTCSARSYYGIHWSDYENPATVNAWNQATFDGGPFDNHQVSEIRYCNLTYPFLASDMGRGPIYSDPGNDPPAGDGFGKDWHRDANAGALDSLSDITCPVNQTKRAAYHPWDARSGFIWGARKWTAKRATTGGAWYKETPSSSWTDCTGDLDTNGEWRSVIVTASDTVLVGGEGGEGIYREEADGGTCGTWIDGNEGLATTSKEVIAFVETANGILAAIQESSEGANDGGVYFSENESDGFAWVKTDEDLDCSSNYEMSGGSKYYTGSTCDGVWASETIDYTKTPTAFFVPGVNYTDDHDGTVDVCIDQPIKFTNRTAGRGSSPTWSWDFGDSQSSTDESPRHAYASSGTYYPQLSATNNGHSDTYSVTVNVSTDTAMEITDNSLRLSYSGGQTYLTWTDLSGETGYKIWASDDLSASPTVIKTVPADDTTDVSVDSHLYYRVQPVSAACGGGVIGGEW